MDTLEFPWGETFYFSRSNFNNVLRSTPFLLLLSSAKSKAKQCKRKPLMTQVEASFGGEFEKMEKENAELKNRLMFQDKERQVGILVGGRNKATNNVVLLHT